MGMKVLQLIKARGNGALKALQSMDHLDPIYTKSEHQQSQCWDEACDVALIEKNGATAIRYRPRTEYSGKVLFSQMSVCSKGGPHLHPIILPSTGHMPFPVGFIQEDFLVSINFNVSCIASIIALTLGVNGS